MAISDPAAMPAAFFIQNRRESKRAAAEIRIASVHLARRVELPNAPGGPGGSADVERLGAGRLARAVERDLLDPGFGLPQQLLAAALERLAALVDRHRF